MRQADRDSQEIDDSAAYDAEAVRYTNSNPLSLPVVELKRSWDGANWCFEFGDAAPIATGPSPIVPPEVTVRVPVEDASLRQQKVQVSNEKRQPISNFDRQKIFICPSWLSVSGYLVLFFIASYITVRLSEAFPEVMLYRDSFLLFGDTYEIVFPWLSLGAAFFLGRAFYNVYNKYVVMDDRTLELHDGVLTLSSETVEMETDTLLVVQVSQSPIEKLLNVGTISIGRFSKNTLEFSIPGVYKPFQFVKFMKRRIKASRLRKAKQTTDFNADEMCVDSEY